MRSNDPQGGGQDARHKLPGIRQVKKSVLTDGLFGVPAGYALPDGGSALSGLRFRQL
ncbi:hypothetical protein NI420_001925 [Salmonella enterica]|nr:hypothetical protein [Salmonella enterica]EJJ4246967.1 hypothetical protein [Salmonella enterica]